MAEPTQRPPKLVLLLGAGASIAADVPTTVDFVDEFEKAHRSDEDLAQVIMELRTSDRNTDVEKLLRVLYNLSRWEDVPEHTFLSRDTRPPAATEVLGVGGLAGSVHP